MFVLFEEAGKFLGRPRAVGGRCLGPGGAGHRQARQGQGAPTSCCKFEKPAPAELLAEARSARRTASTSTWPGNSRPKGEFGFADLAARVFPAPMPTLVQQAAALLALFEAPHYFRRAGKGRFKKAPAEIVQQALAAIEKKKQVQAQIAEWAGAAGRGRMPGADPRAALQDPVQARQERARIQGRGRGLARHADARRSTCCSAPAPSTRPTSSTGGASCSRTSPRAPASRRCSAPAIADELPLADGAGLLDRRFADHRDRRCAVGAGPGQRHGDRRHPHRRAGPGAGAGQRRSTRWRARACPPSTCRATRSRCCPTTWSRPTRCRKAATARPCRCTCTFDEATLELKATETAPGARADRRQPAPRPARRRRHRGLAGRRLGHRPTARRKRPRACASRCPSCSAWPSS